MDCDVRDSVMFRLDSLRHLVVRCVEIANVSREVILNLQRIVSILSNDFQAIYIWTSRDTRLAGFSHRTEGYLLTAYPGNNWNYSLNMVSILWIWALC